MGCWQHFGGTLPRSYGKTGSVLGISYPSKTCRYYTIQSFLHGGNYGHKVAPSTRSFWMGVDSSKLNILKLFNIPRNGEELSSATNSAGYVDFHWYLPLLPNKYLEKQMLCTGTRKPLWWLWVRQYTLIVANFITFHDFSDSKADVVRAFTFQCWYHIDDEI